MNARTARLLRRVANVMYVNDPHDPRQPESLVLNGLKRAWHATPRPARGTSRRGIVAATQQLITAAEARRV